MEEESAAYKPKDDIKTNSFNYKAHQKGIKKDEMVNIYTEWSKNGKYEEDVNPSVYHGPFIAAETLATWIPEGKRSSLRVLDLAAGTGLLGRELAKNGFMNIDALDSSEGMLEEARKKNVYKNVLCQYFDNDSELEDDSYDALIISGGMGEGHIPGNSILKMQKVVKKGGLIVIVMCKEYLSYVEDYKDLISKMEQMEKDQMWKILSQKTVDFYSFNREGMVFIFEVLK